MRTLLNKSHQILVIVKEDHESRKRSEEGQYGTSFKISRTLTLFVAQP
jgi:hypothetical protein